MGLPERALLFFTLSVLCFTVAGLLMHRTARIRPDSEEAQERLLAAAPVLDYPEDDGYWRRPA